MAAGAEPVQQAVDDLAQVHRPLGAAAPGRRNQRPHQRPFLVRQIARVTQPAAVIAPAILARPHRRPPNESGSLPLESQMIPTIQHVRGRTLSGKCPSGSRLIFESVWGFPGARGVRVWGMRTGISLSVAPADIDWLRGLVKDRNAPQKHVWRAQFVLLTAEGAGTTAIMRKTGKSKTCVWRWQERFAAEGVAGLLRDKTRPSRIPKFNPAVAGRGVASTRMRRQAKRRTGPARRWPGLPASAFPRCSASGARTAPAASRPAVQAVQGPRVRRQDA